MVFPSCFSKKYLIPLFALSLCYRKSGYGCSLLKANKEARFVQNKVCFNLDPGNWRMGVGWTPAQRPAPPPLTVEARAFRAGGREALSALPVMLKLVTQWSGQHHLDCFKYYYSSAPRSVCSHIFEAGSRNCSSLCHGYSLVIMPLTSSTWWGFNLYKSAHRRRLRTGSMSHEEELKVLDYAQ